MSEHRNVGRETILRSRAVSGLVMTGLAFTALTGCGGDGPEVAGTFTSINCSKLSVDPAQFAPSVLASRPARRAAFAAAGATQRDMCVEFNRVGGVITDTFIRDTHSHGAVVIVEGGNPKDVPPVPSGQVELRYPVTLTSHIGASFAEKQGDADLGHPVRVSNYEAGVADLSIGFNGKSFQMFDSQSADPVLSEVPGTNRSVAQVQHQSDAIGTVLHDAFEWLGR